MKTNINGIDVEGIVLSDRAIKILKFYQKDDNFGGDNGVDQDCGIIKNAICFLASLYDEVDEDLFKAATKLMCELNRVQKNINELHSCYIYDFKNNNETI